MVNIKAYTGSYFAEHAFFSEFLISVKYNYIFWTERGGGGETL